MSTPQLTIEELAQRVAEESTKIGTPEAIDAIYALRQLEEDWARTLLGIADTGDLLAQVRECAEHGLASGTAEHALRHLGEVETWQGAIGSLASGSGEGLASMGKVHELRLAQAWLAAAIASHYREQAEELAASIEADPNGTGERHAPSLRALRRLLTSRASGRPSGQAG